MMNLENAANLASYRDKLQPGADADRRAARRVGVIVLGMHRSGSSAITRMLSLLGCSLPKTLMPPNAGNMQGHWESDAVAQFNDEILAQAGTSWHDWLPVNPRLSETLIWPQLVARGRELLRQEFADAPLFVLKDPRICKLAGLWNEVLAAEGVDSAFVLTLRNPIEVARSLSARDGIDEHSGLLIWLRHVLAAEAASRGRHRVFTDYSTLLNNWEALADKAADQLGVVWPRVSVLSAEEISQFLTPDLRHHFSETAEVTGNSSVSPWIAKTYEVLAGWAQHGESAADYPVLDGIMRAFDKAGVAFARPLRNAALAEQRAAQIEAERATLAQDRDHLAQRLGQVEAEIVATGEQRDAIAGERDHLAQRLGEVEAGLTAAASERDAILQDRDTLSGERDALVSERDELAGRLRETQSQLDLAADERDTRTAERDGLAGDLAMLAEERAKLAWYLGEVEADLGRVAAERDARTAERDLFSGERSALVEERAALAEERDKLAWRLGEVEADLVRAVAERDWFGGERAALADERDKAQWRL
ncbi:MAG: hypothetical protein M3N34_02595, partial [Pseudomonadota bacterium]|nr:hypothetical protein [Pseudomonadota bacterium]